MAAASPTAIKAPLRSPPGPKGHFLLGNLAAVSRDWLGFYSRCAKHYGDVVQLRYLHVPICLLMHPRDIEYVLVTNPGNFTKSADYRALARVLGNGLLTNEGKSWQSQRALIQPAFRRENILSYAPLMTRAAARLLASWTVNESRNVHEDMMAVTLDIVAQCLFGTEVTGVAERVGKAAQILTDRFIADAGLALLLPFDLPDFLAPARRHAISELNKIINSIIRERRASKQPRGDLLGTLLEVRDSEGRAMSDAQLRDEVMTLFLAGHETTALALSWTCFLLANNPEVEAKLVEELRAVLGEREPTVEDLPRLRYTEMILKESMRLYPAVWGVGRRAIADCEIGGYRVAAGTNIFIFQALTQRDPRFFSNPDEFDPERWREDPVRSGKIPRFAYFPFGGGPRVCVGASFAMLEATLLLAMIQQKFHLDLVPGHPVEPLPSVTLRPKHGIRVTVHRRAFST
ncbi:MAG TPA: cytochrome P450 [Candidatus Acidoferrales bacterium]|nr:cytochrome P450 [Candidatus Acidoferrales bacterium]